MLVDATESYELAFYLLGVIGTIGSVLLVIVARITRRASHASQEEELLLGRREIRALDLKTPSDYTKLD